MKSVKSYVESSHSILKTASYKAYTRVAKNNSDSTSLLGTSSVSILSDCFCISVIIFVFVGVAIAAINKRTGLNQIIWYIVILSVLMWLPTKAPHKHTFPQGSKHFLGNLKTEHQNFAMLDIIKFINYGKTKLRKECKNIITLAD